MLSFGVLITFRGLKKRKVRLKKGVPLNGRGRRPGILDS